MLKKIAVALLCAALGSSLYARDDISQSRTFIGLELGYVEVQGDTFYDIGYVGDYDVEFGFRIGAEKDEWRTTFLFDYYDSSDNDQNVEKFLMTVDYFILNNGSAFRPFIGLNAGYANYESTFVEDSGFIYGGQVGFVVDITDMVNLDLSYRYSLSGNDVFDHVGGVTFGLNYFF
jgi:opacity protein-like surface antigen